jgi:magnesium-transporting ATPase (P-type)
MISPLHPFSAIAPLIIVLSVAMAREGFEDYFRYKSDIEQNSSTTHVYRGGQFEQVAFHELNVGDVVQI